MASSIFLLFSDKNGQNVEGIGKLLSLNELLWHNKKS